MYYSTKNRFKGFKYLLLISVLVFSLVFPPGGFVNPKEAKADLVLSALALIGTCVIIGALKGATSYIINYGLPNSADKRESLGLEVLKGAGWGLAIGLAGILIAYLAAFHLAILMEIGAFSIAQSIILGVSQSDWQQEIKDAVNLAHNVYVSVGQYIAPAFWEFYQDNAYLGPLFLPRMADPVNGFVKYLKKYETLYSDSVTTFTANYNSAENGSVLQGFEILSADTGDITDHLFTTDSIKIRSYVDASFMGTPPEGAPLGTSCQWYIYNYQSNTWYQLDTASSVNNGAWLDQTYTSMAFSGQGLLNLAGISLSDNKPVAISAGWNLTIDGNIVSSGTYCDLTKPPDQQPAGSAMILTVKESPSLTVTSPNGGEQWQLGEMKNITWSSSGTPGDYVKIEIIRDGQNGTIIDSTPNDGSYPWPVAGQTSNNCKIRISSVTRPQIYSESSGPFSILPYCYGHDLKVDNIRASKPTMIIDEANVITADIFNMKNVAESNISVTLSVNGPNYTCPKTSAPINLSALGTTTVNFTWPTGCVQQPTANSYYTATIRTNSSVGCDENYADNEKSISIYVADLGTAPDVKGYNVKKYNITPTTPVTVGTKTFALEWPYNSTSYYYLSISGENSQSYDKIHSYTSSDGNQYTWWFNTYGADTLVLNIGQADNTKGFTDFSKSVILGETVTFNSSVDYYKCLTYNVTGDPTKGIRVDFLSTPDGYYSSSGNNVLVDTTGLQANSYKFAVLSDTPKYDRYVYLTAGQFNVINPSYLLNIQKSGTGSGQVSVNGVLHSLPYSESFNSGMSPSLQAIPDSNVRFTGWTADLNSTTNPTSIIMNSNKNITANFTSTYLLSLQKIGTGSGQVKVNGTQHALPYSETFDVGSIVNLEAIEGNGSSFTAWSGDQIGTNKTTSITMNGNRSINLNFAISRTLTVHINPEAGGSIMADGTLLVEGQTKQYLDGQTAHLTAIRSTNYAFVNWGGDASTSGANLQAEMVMNGDKSVTANFTNSPAISVTPDTLDFGSIPVETTSDRLFIVQNTGGGTLSGSASVPAPFSVVSGSPYSVGAGESRTITVHYSPTASGLHTQSIVFTGAAGVTKSVTGNAVSEAEVPTVTGFDIPATSTSLTVPIAVFTATDNEAVTGYLVNESAVKPSAGAAGWSATPPASYVFATAGDKILYAWAKDAAGNVSDSASDSVTITYSIPPAATTNAATNVTVSGAILNGTVNANNASTTVTFQYGLTTSYGYTVTADQSPVTGNINTSVSKGITGLTPDTTYHCRVAGVNSADTTYGNDMTFTTNHIVSEIPVFTPYSGNPIRSSYTIPISKVIKLNNEYRGYFVESNTSGTYPADFNVDVIKSVDGITWGSIQQNIISSQQTGQTFNYNLMELKVGDTYKAWHSATSDWMIAYTKLYHSTSTDGVTYTPHGLVLDNNPYPQYDSRNINNPHVLFDGSAYRLYYNANAGNSDDWEAATKIAYANSIDGVNWTKQGVVVDIGATGSFDSQHAYSPTVLFDGSVYEMFYGASDGTTGSTGYAVSTDGLNWQKKGKVTSIDGTVTGVVKENGLYKIWYYKYNDHLHNLYYAEAPAATSAAIKGDIDGLNGVTIADAILALKIISGMSPTGIRTNYASSGADVNGDGKVGMAEVIYILQKVAGFR